MCTSNALYKLLIDFPLLTSMISSKHDPSGTTQSRRLRTGRAITILSKHRWEPRLRKQPLGRKRKQ